jgi:hypothetical protein
MEEESDDDHSLFSRNRRNPVSLNPVAYGLLNNDTEASYIIARFYLDQRDDKGMMSGCQS